MFALFFWRKMCFFFCKLYKFSARIWGKYLRFFGKNCCKLFLMCGLYVYEWQNRLWIVNILFIIGRNDFMVSGPLWVVYLVRTPDDYLISSDGGRRDSSLYKLVFHKQPPVFPEIWIQIILIFLFSKAAAKCFVFSPQNVVTASQTMEIYIRQELS